MKIAFLGLGSMGRGICRNLLKKNHILHVWNRSAEKTALVAAWGGIPFGTPAKAAEGVDAVFVCLSSVAALRSTVEGAHGLYSVLNKGSVLYDLGTWDIASVLALQEAAERQGVVYVHLPMGKGPEAAEAGETPLFFGGPREVFDRDEPLLRDIGTPFYMGDVRAACAFKLITNLIGLSNNVVLTEGVRLARRMGLSEEAFMTAAESTGAWSYQMGNSGRKVFAEAFLPMRGTLDNAWKDMKFGVAMAEEAGVSCPAFTMLRDRYKAASEAGYGQEDYISVYRLLKDAEK